MNENSDEIVKVLRNVANQNRPIANWIFEDSAYLIEQQQTRIAELEHLLTESQRREREAVEDIEKMMRICEKGSCHFCANGDCTESPYCAPKWRGPQEAGKGEAE